MACLLYSSPIYLLFHPQKMRTGEKGTSHLPGDGVKMTSWFAQIPMMTTDWERTPSEFFLGIVRLLILKSLFPHKSTLWSLLLEGFFVLMFLRVKLPGLKQEETIWHSVSKILRPSHWITINLFKELRINLFSQFHQACVFFSLFKRFPPLFPLTFSFFFFLVTGCHHVSFTTTVPRTKVEAAPHCLPKDINSPLFLTNSLMTRWSLQDARLSFSVCSDVVSYVRCATTWFIPGLTHTIFSTVAIPLSIPLAPNANTPAASFSYQDALNALAPAVYGERKVVCGGFFPGFCGDWMVPSLVDPLIFWPPSPQLPKLDTEGINVYGEYYNATDAQPLERSLTIVIVMKSGPTEFFSRDQLDQMSLSVLFVTNELGESPELIDNSFDANEKTSASPQSILANDFVVLLHST